MKAENCPVGRGRRVPLSRPELPTRAGVGAARLVWSLGVRCGVGGAAGPSELLTRFSFVLVFCVFQNTAGVWRALV